MGSGTFAIYTSGILGESGCREWSVKYARPFLSQEDREFWESFIEANCRKGLPKSDLAIRRLRTPSGYMHWVAVGWRDEIERANVCGVLLWPSPEREKFSGVLENTNGNLLAKEKDRILQIMSGLQKELDACEASPEKHFEWGPDELVGMMELARFEERVDEKRPAKSESVPAQSPSKVWLPSKIQIGLFAVAILLLIAVWMAAFSSNRKDLLPEAVHGEVANTHSMEHPQIDRKPSLDQQEFPDPFQREWESLWRKHPEKREELLKALRERILEFLEKRGAPKKMQEIVEKMRRDFLANLPQNQEVLSLLDRLDHEMLQDHIRKDGEALSADDTIRILEEHLQRFTGFCEHKIEIQKKILDLIERKQLEKKALDAKKQEKDKMKTRDERTLKEFRKEATKTP